MKKLITFTEVEIEKVKKVMEKEGLRSFSETVRACVRQWHDDKYYTKHKEKSYNLRPLGIKVKAPEPTNEQACESIGGIVKGINCIIPYRSEATGQPIPGNFDTIPLNQIKSYIKNKNK